MTLDNLFSLSNLRFQIKIPDSGTVAEGTSMSELSGISSASAKTYITEESSLVLECTENGVVR